MQNGNPASRGWLRTAGVAAATIALTLGAACGRRTPDPAPAPPAAGATLLWVDGPSGKVRVEDGGSGGVPVVFVHGLAGDRSVWAAQLAHLRRSRRAVALDLHGMGESAPSPSGDYTVPSVAADVAAVVEALRLGRVVLVGHSLGGHVIAAAAAARPAATAALVFDDPAGDLSRLPRADIEARFLARMEPASYDAFVVAWFGEMLAAARPEVRERVMATMKRTPRAVVAAAARGLVENRPTPEIAAFKGPMLAIVTPENQVPNSLHKLVPDLPATVIAGTSHWLMMDKPEEFNAALDAFLAGVK